MTLVWLPRVIEDRDAQLDYIARDSPAVAIEQGDRLNLHISQLLDHPEIGRPGRMKASRELVILRTPFVEVYRLRREPKRIEILRVLHSAQSWPAADR